MSPILDEVIVELKAVEKEYPLGRLKVPAIRGLELSINYGEFLAFAGPSGSGKTTLLNLIGCLDTPTSGEVRLAGTPTTAMSERRLTRFRLEKIGFVFQSFNLVRALTAYHNVELPLLLQKRLGKQDRRRQALDLLEQVGLRDHAQHRPTELSGGQQQRVAIARALVTKPLLVLADEPTANLDSATSEEIIGLMREINRQNGTTFVFSTHDPMVMSQASRVVKLVDGRSVE